MQESAIPVLNKDAPVKAALQQIEQSGGGGLLVAESDGPWGWVSAQDLQTVIVGDGASGPTLAQSVTTEPLPHLYPDLSLDAAMRSFQSHTVLPVVSRANAASLIGVLTLDDVHRTYGIRPVGPTEH
jgi:CBS domain-containing protein